MVANQLIDQPSSNTGGAVPLVILSIGPVVLAAPGRAVDLHHVNNLIINLIIPCN